MADVIIVLAALGMAGMGFYALSTPSSIPAIFGGTAPSADSRNEIRAVYGGFGVAVAALLAWVALADSAAGCCLRLPRSGRRGCIGIAGRPPHA